MTNMQIAPCDFFTDEPLVPLVVIRSGGSGTVRPTDASSKLRYFCGGNEPTMLYQPPGPLSWDE